MDGRGELTQTISYSEYDRRTVLPTNTVVLAALVGSRKKKRRIVMCGTLFIQRTFLPIRISVIQCRVV